MHDRFKGDPLDMPFPGAKRGFPAPASVSEAENLSISAGFLGVVATFAS
jgi:hypothetical protein